MLLFLLLIFRSYGALLVFPCAKHSLTVYHYLACPHNLSHYSFFLLIIFFNSTTVFQHKSSNSLPLPFSSPLRRPGGAALLPPIHKQDCQTYYRCQKINCILLHSTRLHALYFFSNCLSAGTGSIHHSIHYIFIKPCCWSSN